eukprot:GHRQ01034016.1.p1 GENE.GHRQ01034016.1~~GHRQ01034016.1.p1  ORF type:complete len:161 (-),score=32.43 GHRQ01034016.1:41-523(-)
MLQAVDQYQTLHQKCATQSCSAQLKGKHWLTKTCQLLLRPKRPIHYKLLPCTSAATPSVAAAAAAINSAAASSPPTVWLLTCSRSSLSSLPVSSKVRTSPTWSLMQLGATSLPELDCWMPSARNRLTFTRLSWKNLPTRTAGAAPQRVAAMPQPFTIRQQ